MDRKGGKRMIKDDTERNTLEIISEEKSFHGIADRSEIIDGIVNQLKSGGSICFINSKFPYYQEKFYSDEIINVFVNGLRLKKNKKTMIAGYKVYDISNFIEIEISKMG